jgi:hypothetical protein
MSYRIVPASLRYMDAYRDVAKEFIEESRWPHYNWEKISFWIMQSMNPDVGFSRIILDDENNIAGCMSVIKVDDPFSDMTTTFDVVTTLREPYRDKITGIKYFIKMLNEFKQWSDEQGIDFLRLGNVAGIVEDETYGKLLQKINLHKIGSLYGSIS